MGSKERKENKMLTDAEIRAAVERYVATLQELTNREYAKQFSNLTPPTIKVQFGVKYAKVVKVESNGGGSVHSFVALEGIDTKAITAKAGDILKAASWKAPAPHARGSVFNSNPLEGVDKYGANYLQ